MNPATTEHRRAGIRRPAPLLAVAGVLALILAAPPATGREDALPVEITADHAEMDERAGTGTYTGDVIVVRGDATLEADRVIVHMRERRPYEIEAHGEPARLESPDPETGEMRIAEGLRIDYFLDEERVILTERARVITAAEDARGQRITYDLERDVIRAERGDTDDERVHIRLQPREDDP
ncbi:MULTISPECIES: lipopolysaccharide transport periplasmic protein LptA [Thioalkalivibrio]|uniref:Lipopolysaccharide export system protein LptA n=1 Tax=Thioalkalivibrio halophilus TaxID=252474 RepID=A0A1V2ZVM5_9GAMM|nr:MULTISPECIES: lipopolysaccharide transport periplasmic protein LptA [Thioalkalivibrio]OOC08873.1 lipopolysaccharide transport periplasmic protein LptA [Thioalkalivibrio halophilus]PYG03138.1 lipopolysaccharide export system protein LptA [Thioalkalivibrio sp. ALE21]